MKEENEDEYKNAAEVITHSMRYAYLESMSKDEAINIITRMIKKHYSQVTVNELVIQLITNYYEIQEYNDNTIDDDDDYPCF